jgi:hypothetical protein
MGKAAFKLKYQPLLSKLSSLEKAIRTSKAEKEELGWTGVDEDTRWMDLYVLFYFFNNLG